MQYLLMICAPDAEVAAITGAAAAELMAEYGQFRQSIVSSGNYLGSNRLKPATTATSVRVRDGKTLVTDGPFAETREQLGGYYLIEAPNLDDAIAIAARIPGARTGTIEVRPIWTPQG